MKLLQRVLLNRLIISLEIKYRSLGWRALDLISAALCLLLLQVKCTRKS
jgi:hypothetical protein